jgi:hypothetical protein
MVGKKIRRPQDFTESIRLRQRNTAWPDTLRNSRGVDQLFWHGSPQATVIQEVGALVFGLGFLCVGISFLYWSTQTSSLFIRFLGALLLCLGVRVSFKVFFPTKLNKAG